MYVDGRLMVTLKGDGIVARVPRHSRELRREPLCPGAYPAGRRRRARASALACLHSCCSDGLDATLRERPLLAVPLLFGAGVATSLTPCIYPMIPITAGILGGAGAAGRSRGRTALLTGAYVGGLALVYSLLGLLAGLTGTIFGAVSSNPWAYFVMANVLLLAGLAMLDIVPVARAAGGGDRGRRGFAADPCRPRSAWVPLPAWWRRRAARRRSPLF